MNNSRKIIQETELVKHYIEVTTEMCSEAGSEVSGGGSCDCPAHVHDKELPLELVKKRQAETVDNVNYGFSSHFDF